MELKDKIFKHAKKRLNEYRNSPAWLQDSLLYNHILRLEEKKKFIIKNLFDEVNEKYIYKPQKLIDLEILIANLLNADKRNKPIRISLNINNYKKSKYRKTGYFTRDAVHLLNEKGYLEMKKGCYTKDVKFFTRIWATEKLIDYCKLLPKFILEEPVRFVELRESKIKYKKENGKIKKIKLKTKPKLIEYDDTAKTRRIEAILTHINAVNKEADISYKNYRITPYLVAIFIEKITLYGRLHVRGYKHYQSYSGNERKEITINGEKVVELDYSGMHPRLLYASVNRQYDKDVYELNGVDKLARSFLKTMLLCMLNTISKKDAEGATNKDWFSKQEDKEFLHSIGIFRARPLMDAFIEKHKRIAHYFFSEKKTGLRLMNKDATIALAVVNHFAKQNIPVLPMHDSFIVQAKYEDKLRSIMDETYRKNTGGFSCKLK